MIEKDEAPEVCRVEFAVQAKQQILQHIADDCVSNKTAVLAARALDLALDEIRELREAMERLG